MTTRQGLSAVFYAVTAMQLRVKCYDFSQEVKPVTASGIMEDAYWTTGRIGLKTHARFFTQLIEPMMRGVFSRTNEQG